MEYITEHYQIYQSLVDYGGILDFATLLVQHLLELPLYVA